MFKILTGCFAIIFCTVLGKKITSKYFEHLIYFESLQQFNLNLKTNLKFKQDSIVNLLDKEYKSKEFSLTLQSFKACTFNFGNISDLYMPQWIKDDDASFIRDYLLNLGKGNSVSEMDFIDVYQNLIDEKLVKIKDNNCKFTNLGKRLGFSAGIALFILIL